jgi:hypothetical protein
MQIKKIGDFLFRSSMEEPCSQEGIFFEPTTIFEP